MIKNELAHVIPLLLAEKLGEVKGKTRMQKLVYLVERKARKKKLLNFTYAHELSHYGPFSLDLAHIVFDLTEDNYLKVGLKLTPEDRLLFVYKITVYGERFLDRLRSSKEYPKELGDVIDKVVKEYGYLPLQELVAKAYDEMEKEEPEYLY